ncbi:MAG: radical SAM protein [Candidatus Woesearchaeota archaeon]
MMQDHKIGIISYPIFKERYQLQDSGRLFRMHGLLKDDFDVSLVPIDCFFMENVAMMDRLFYQMKFNDDINKILSETMDIFETMYAELSIGEYGQLFIFPREDKLYRLILTFLDTKKGHTIITQNLQETTAEELLEQGYIDVFIRERKQEYLLRDVSQALVKGSELGKISGIMFMKDGTINMTEPASLDLDYFMHSKIYYEKSYIDKLRLFSSNLEMVNDIFSENHIFYRFSFGCPRRCAYCPGSNFPFAMKDYTTVIEEIKDIKKETGSRYFLLDDPDVAVDKEFLSAFCKGILSEDLDILWASEIFPSVSLTQRDFNMMSETGCVLLMFGVESGSERLLRFLGRGTTVETTKKCLKASASSNIFTFAHVIVGLPSEDDTDVEATRKLLLEMREVIDATSLNYYWLDEKSVVASNPEYYMVRRRQDGSFVYLDSEGKEIPNMDELLETRREKLASDFGYGNLSRYFIQSYDKMIYPLFDHLKSRDKVKDFLEQNEHLIFKEKGYFSISLGLASNQRNKGTRFFDVAEKHKFVDFGYFKEAVDSYFSDQFTAYGFHSIMITGGEPTIHPDFFRFMRYVKRKNPRKVIIKTNARMLANNDFCNKLSEYADEILVIDPADNEEGYEEISKVTGSWRQSRKGIENWRSIGMVVNHWSP